MSVVFPVSMGLLSLPSLVFGIIGLVFGKKQKKLHKNKWSKWGIGLSIAGIILAAFVLIYTVTYFLTNPALIQQYTQ
jgi:hypothetical protein